MSQREEEAKLQAHLIGRYGRLTAERALEMSGMKAAMQALASGTLTEEQRAAAYVMASMHLANLCEMLLTSWEAKALTECSKRIDAAFDLWAADDIERRVGLPSMDDSTREKARAASRHRNKRPDDVASWANKLANDVKDAGD